MYIFLSDAAAAPHARVFYMGEQVDTRSGAVSCGAIMGAYWKIYMSTLRCLLRETI